MNQYIYPNNIYPISDDPEQAKMDRVSCRYKDLGYYVRNYFIFGAFYCLFKEIFGNTKEREWIRQIP